MRSLIQKVLILMIGSFAIMMGCSNEPMGLGEVLLKTLYPKDGRWSGKTSQNKDISFDVSKQGTQIDAGLTIGFYCSEYWGYVNGTIERTVPTPINGNQFDYNSSGFSIGGVFENSTSCTGDFSISGNTGYPNYLSFSGSGTWTADWKSGSGSLSKPVVDPGLIEEKEQYTEKIVGYNIIKITFHFLK
jgi:hypothetical protein